MSFKNIRYTYSWRKRNETNFYNDEYRETETVNRVVIRVNAPEWLQNEASNVTHLPQRRTHKVRKSASQVVLIRMQLTLHATRRTPHGASRLAHAMSAWSVNSRRASSPHCRMRVSIPYGHTTTATHETSTSSPYRTPLEKSEYI